jgi:protein NUD1
VRLSDLDLRDNQLLAVKNVGYLSALEQLNLSGNKLTTFGATRQLRSLRSLKVSDNTIHSLDVSRLQGIKLLYADRNCLSAITGLEECYDVEILSLREQHLADSTKNLIVDLDLTPLGSLRKMFLSSNRLAERVLAPISSVPSLQLLDVAACGLRELPSNFGRKFPNLRVVNLNFNAITDLRGLFGIHGLRRLTAVGNRISRLRRLCQSISQISGDGPGCVASLKSIDLRGNPLTVGFYPPSVSGSGKREGIILSRASKSGENTAWPQRSNNANRGRASTTAEHGTGIVESEPPNIRDTSSDDGRIPAEIEIDDPYTIPAADADADEKYRSHLDESTKTRRFVVQLMVFASTSGALQTMDGLELRTILESDRSRMDRVWGQLEALGVFRKKKEANGERDLL